jgi:hypothetical protein
VTLGSRPDLPIVVAAEVMCAAPDFGHLAREILADADAVDAAEDERFGDARG